MAQWVAFPQWFYDQASETLQANITFRGFNVKIVILNYKYLGIVS